jgi:hypothetical protein
MKTLQSMTDFVLEQEPNAMSNSLSNIIKHAKTLKLKPELWMFVPTDENGNVINQCDCKNQCGYCKENKQYQTALSKVWFKEFEVIKYKHHYYLTYDKIAIYFFENGEVKLENKYNPYNINCIEDLTRHKIEITENFGKNLLL